MRMKMRTKLKMRTEMRMKIMQKNFTLVSVIYYLFINIIIAKKRRIFTRKYQSLEDKDKRLEEEVAKLRAINRMLLKKNTKLARMNKKNGNNIQNK
jgi:ABC-type multidrug transport system fused ATPase/permease subunit